MGGNGKTTYRLEISDTLSGDLTLLSPKKTLLLEDEAGAYEETTGNSEDDADDLEQWN